MDMYGLPLPIAYCLLPDVQAHCVAYFLPFAFHTHVPRSPCAFWRRPTFVSPCAHAHVMLSHHLSAPLSNILFSLSLSTEFVGCSLAAAVGVAGTRARKRICESLFWSVSSWLSSCLVRLWWSALNLQLENINKHKQTNKSQSNHLPTD